MNVLCFYDHQRYFSDVCKVGHEIYFWSQFGVPQWWGIKGTAPPGNAHFVDNLPNIHYDVALISDPKEIEMVREHYPDIPIIAVCGGEAPEYMYNNECVAVVASCWRNLEICTHPNKFVIYASYDPDEYSGYTGDIECLVTVAGSIERRIELRKPLIDQCVAGLPHLFIGEENESLRNGVGYVRHDTIMNILRHFRSFVYLPADICGSSMAVGEAFMTGMPVALSDFADWSSFIQNGVNGFVSNDIDELTRFLKLCLASKSYAREVGQRGREIASKFFHIREFVALWTDLINKVSSGIIQRIEQ